MTGITKIGDELMRNPIPPLFAKTASTFSDILKKDIRLVTENSGFYVCMDTEIKAGFKINIDFNDKLIDAYTGLEHELSHIIFKTPIQTLLHIIEPLVSTTPPNFQSFARRMLKDSFNIIEDQRIESMYGSIYAGSKYKFEKTRRALGTGMAEAKDPVTALLAHRFYRDDLISGTEFAGLAKYVDQVVLKSNKASILSLKMFWEEFLKAWIMQQSEDMEKLEKQCSEHAKKICDLYNKARDGATGEEKSQAQKEYDEECQKRKKTEDEWKAKKRELSEALDEAEDKASFRDDGFSVGGEMSKKDEQKLGEEITIEELGHMLETEGKIGEGELGKLKDDLAKLAEPQKVEPYNPDIIKTITRPELPFVVDDKLVRDIRNMFREIKEAYKPALDEDGQDIEIDEFIQQGLRKENEYFLDEQISTGLDIVLAVDLSGSMREERQELARNLGATFMKALGGLRGINFKILAWSSPRDSYGLSVTEITTLQGCRHITIDRENIHNSNSLAMLYSVRMLKKMPGQKKLVMVITDGLPECRLGKGMRAIDLMNNTRGATDYALKNNIEVFSVYVGRDGGAGSALMPYLYHDRVTAVTDMTQAKTILVKELKKQLMEKVRR